MTFTFNPNGDSHRQVSGQALAMIESAQAMNGQLFDLANPDDIDELAKVLGAQQHLIDNLASVIEYLDSNYWKNEKAKQ